MPIGNVSLDSLFDRVEATDKYLQVLKKKIPFARFR